MESIRLRYKKCYDTIAKDSLIQTFEKGKHKRLSRTAKLIGKGYARILDVGCADGELLEILGTNGLKVGLDISVVYLNIAKKKFDVILADAENMPLRQGTFEAVVCSDLLEHVLNPENVVEEIRRILTNKGKAFFVVPWEEDLEIYKAMPYEFTHLRTFDKYSIRKLLRSFNILKSAPVAAKSPAFHYLVPKFVRSILWLLLPFYLKVRLFGILHLFIMAEKK
jgi:ubiquinone/menaquinone biosynthesis C-methylase UbiE